MAAAAEKIILRDIPDLHKIDVYIKNGGYESLKKSSFQNESRTRLLKRLRNQI